MDSDEELQQLRAQLETAELVGERETASHCCYSTSDKYWVTDPQGVAWETYHTLTSIPTLWRRFFVSVRIGKERLLHSRSH